MCSGADRRGVTLLELLIVLVIVGLLAGVVGPSVTSHLRTARVRTAHSQLNAIALALEAYRLDVGDLPSESDGLEALTSRPSDEAIGESWRGPYLRRATPLDPWGNPYLYQLDDEAIDGYVLLSYGRDGQSGGDGENADITLDSAPQR